MGEGLRRAFLATIKSRCVVDDKGCWNWTLTKDKDGYGTTTVMEIDGKKITRVHRQTFYLRHGWIPRLLDHVRCDNPGCCNPDHVEPSTNKKNVLRGSGPTAINARKTHCPYGHLYGTRLFKGKPIRTCKTCRKDQRARNYIRNKS